MRETPAPRLRVGRGYTWTVSLSVARQVPTALSAIVVNKQLKTEAMRQLPMRAPVPSIAAKVARNSYSVNRLARLRLRRL